ncbi:MAG: Holliday junction branch migration DNA helicase RuvB [SAR202 cluster bacterium Casp-Chloro-G4]|nr:Holliday junction branch migration DNA helicase RuvB [Chloroflexota bacterium]MDA1228251.1 Holliday junction branch migration DNA helicase RuvB [Chloroflexota bacterium]PKB61354.1 MAG: Holliday junction branch migration DNA helicase RuvB [SAR202 cluster bacterium Casp-Chloro-G4]
MTERMVSGAPHEDDHNLDNGLRPRQLRDYVGQDTVKGLLDISIKAARQRGEPLDHVLLYGPPGLGKTTLANIMATEMGVRIKVTSGPAIERPGDMVAILTQLQQDDILFIDEIHRLSRTVEEVLYPAMEDFFVSWVIDKGLKARSMNLSIKPFTLIGATTRFGMVSAPLRDRFGNVHRLEFYDNDAMNTIVSRSSRIMEIQSEDEGLQEIARRARGTPRIANRLLRRVRDYALVMANDVITADVARDALTGLAVDELGLDGVDRSVLKSIIEKFNGGPVGLDTIAASISEDSDTIEDVYEPYLLQLGFLDKTPRGRVATRRAYEHFGIAFNQGKADDTMQGSLFQNGSE